MTYVNQELVNSHKFAKSLWFLCQDRLQVVILKTSEADEPHDKHQAVQTLLGQCCTEALEYHSSSFLFPQVSFVSRELVCFLRVSFGFRELFFISTTYFSFPRVIFHFHDLFFISAS